MLLVVVLSEISAVADVATVRVESTTVADTEQADVARAATADFARSPTQRCVVVLDFTRWWAGAAISALSAGAAVSYSTSVIIS